MIGFRAICIRVFVGDSLTILSLSQSAAGLSGHVEVDHCTGVQLTDLIIEALMHKQLLDMWL